MTILKRNLRQGQAMLTVTMGLTVICGMLGLAVDLGWDYFQKQCAQTAADSAAQAGVAAAIANGSLSCGATVVCQASTTCPTNIGSPTTTVQTACVYGEANGFGVDSKSSLSVASGTGTPGSAPGMSTSYYLTATVTRNIPSLFSMAAGRSVMVVAAQSTAAVATQVAPNCIYILDPTGAGALTANNGASITVGCSIAVNSSSSTSISVTGGASINTSGISTVGGYTMNNGGSMSPLPQTGKVAQADPLGSLPSPTVPSSCNYTNYVATGPNGQGGGSTTLYPGTYCGGITIANGTNATISPGAYIVNGGNFHIAGGSTVTGAGVTFYMTGTNSSYGSVTFDNGSNITFSAPTSGTYQGILFDQDRTITSSTAATFAGGANMKLSGTLYFPTTSISYSNGTSQANSATALVAKDISFVGGANFKYDSSGQTTGLVTNSSVLVQ